MKYNSNTWTTEFCFYDIQNVNVIKFCIGTSRQIDRPDKKVKLPIHFKTGHLWKSEILNFNFLIFFLIFRRCFNFPNGYLLKRFIAERERDRDTNIESQRNSDG